MLTAARTRPAQRLTNDIPSVANRRSGGTVSKSNQSAITTGSRLLDGINMRTPAGRRYRDLVLAFKSEVGGTLLESDLAVVKQAAAITLRSEQLQSALVRGEVVDEAMMIRMTNTAKRLITALAKKAKDRKPPRASLADHLRAKVAEVA